MDKHLFRFALDSSIIVTVTQFSCLLGSYQLFIPAIDINYICKTHYLEFVISIAQESSLCSVELTTGYILETLDTP